MRRGGAAEKPFYIEDEETMEFFGFNLGADYCAEHEWGLSDLRFTFGCDDEKLGIEKRRITRVPEDLKYRRGKSGKKPVPDIFAMVSKHNWEGFQEDPVKKWGYYQELEDYTWKDKPPTEFTGAWSGRDFGIAAYSEQAKARLEKLVMAFEKKDVAFWIGGTGGNPFARGGLCFSIVSKVPKRHLDLMLEADVDRIKLEKAAEETGIKELLRKAGKGTIALSPKWATEIRTTKDGEVKTKHPVIFWLNPMEQHLNNFGWFTVEQLELWIQNKGPVPKTKEQQKRA